MPAIRRGSFEADSFPEANSRPGGSPTPAVSADAGHYRAGRVGVGGRLLLIGDCFIKPGNQLVLDRFIEPFIIERRGERRAVLRDLPTDGPRSHRPFPVRRTSPKELYLRTLVFSS